MMMNVSVRIYSIVLAIVLVYGPANAQSIFMNEVMASNGITIADEDGDYEDWIELYNSGDTEVNLEGYGLSDDYGNAFAWLFPDSVLSPGEFLLIWASGKNRTTPGEALHTNFSISAAGEELILTSPTGERIDELIPTAIPRDISYGRQPDGGSEWYFFSEPTPGAPNDTPAFIGQVDPPVFSHTGGFYHDPFDLSIGNADTSISIYYTLDGSEPTDSSSLYGEYIHIYDRDDIPNDISEIPTNINYNWRSPGGQVNKVMVVRARAFADGYLPSETVTHTFIVEPAGAERYTFPLLSIATHRDNFFDDDIGIYVPGSNYVPPSHPIRPWEQQGNFTQRGPEWERTVHMEYFSEDGVRELAHNAGVRIHGGASRTFSHKSLRMYARAGLGSDWFEFPFFKDKTLPRIKRFILRNSGNDIEHTMFRDIFIQQLVKDLDIDYQGYRPVIVFLNGEYWGIHNLRERIDKYYFETNHGVDPDNIDLLTEYFIVREGDDQHYRDLITYLTDNDIADSAHYRAVNSMIDISNFIDYTIAQIYIANTDWPANNIDYWRPKTTDGRWRWVLYDTDFGFGLFDPHRGHLHKTLAAATAEEGSSYPNTSWSTFLLRTLLKNDEFQLQFITRFADVMNTTFDPERVIATIDFFRNMYQPEIEEHRDRWYPHLSKNMWENNIEVMRRFARNRPDAMRNQIVGHFNLQGTANLTLGISEPNAGSIQVNSFFIEENQFIKSDSLDGHFWEGTYFKDIPVRIIAISSPGYAFTGWEGMDHHSDTLIIVPSDTMHFTALFEYDGVYHDGIMNPEPHDLARGPYRFNYWPDDKPGNTFPPHMVFQQTNLTDPGLTDEMTDVYHIPEDEYHSDDHRSIGYPYSLTRRTRLTGWGADGITFINTGRDRDLGAAVLALNTMGLDSIMVSWTGGTRLPNSRIYAIRLQYRVGVTDPFNDVLDEDGEIVEYVRHPIGGHFQFMEPVMLPEEANDQPYVQLRWKYYHVDGTSGPRAKLLLDNILVTTGKHPHTLFPDAFELAQGDYTFDYWSREQPEHTFPPNMVFLQSRMDDPVLNDEMVEPYHIPYLNADHNAYHANDQFTTGFPYNLTGRTRINGLEDDGIAFINTGRGRDLGAAVLALNTEDRKNVTVNWSAGTIIPSSRTYNIRLLYRVGKNSPFMTVFRNGMPVEYERSDLQEFEKDMGSVSLPSDVDNKPYVQIKWKYYYTGQRLDPEVGSRDMLRLGNIRVTSRSLDDDTDEPEIPTEYFLEQNFPNPFNPSTVIRYGLPENSMVTINVFSVLGREVAGLVHGEQPAGIHTVDWILPQRGIASGVYYYRIEATSLEDPRTRYVETKPMVVIK